MNTKRLVLVAGVSLALVMALGAGVLVGSLAGNSVFAQGPTSTPQAFGPGGMMGGRGMMGSGVAPAQPVTGTTPFAGGLGMMAGARGLGYNEIMIPSLAKALGLTVEQLQAELKAGKTVPELAKAKGITTEKLTADVLAAHAQALVQLVKDGKITQQMADWMTERMGQNQDHPCLTGEVTLGQGPTQGGRGKGRGGMMGRQGTIN